MQVAKVGARLLARLQVYEAAARFQVAAEDALRGFAEGVDTPLQQSLRSCTETRSALDQLATALHASLSCHGAEDTNSRIECSDGEVFGI